MAAGEIQISRQGWIRVSSLNLLLGAMMIRALQVHGRSAQGTGPASWPAQQPSTWPLVAPFRSSVDMHEELVDVQDFWPMPDLLRQNPGFVVSNHLPTPLTLRIELTTLVSISSQWLVNPNQLRTWCSLFSSSGLVLLAIAEWQGDSGSTPVRVLMKWLHSCLVNLTF